jgi:hypothetical protein
MSRLVAAIDRFWWTPAPPERLALLRMLVGGFAVGYLLIRWPNLVSYADFPERRFEPVGLANVLGEPLAGDVFRVLLVGAVVSGVAFVAGWKYRVSAPLFAVLLLSVMTYRNSWGQIFHTENLMVLHVVILAAAPASDALSLDSPGRARAAADGRYGWAVQLMCLVTVLTYFIGGETKLRNAGFDWLSGENLRNYVAYDNLRKAEFGDTYSPLAAPLLSHAWVFTPLALLTLVVELGAPIAMFSRRIARVWVAAAWGFHVGILATMAIVFPYPLLGVAFAPFFAVERVRLPEWLSLRRRLGRLSES